MGAAASNPPRSANNWAIALSPTMAPFDSLSAFGCNERLCDASGLLGLGDGRTDQEYRMAHNKQGTARETKYGGKTKSAHGHTMRERISAPIVTGNSADLKNFQVLSLTLSIFWRAERKAIGAIKRRPTAASAISASKISSRFCAPPIAEIGRQ